MKFILKTFIVAPLLAFVLASEKESPVRRLRRKLQVAAKNFGRNHSGNLGLCEGDCNTNAECRGDLVCLQRDAGDSAPGCNLSSSQRNSRVDFCVARGGASNPPSPVAAPVRAPPTSSGRSFALKLYWEKGYYWQEERIERKWCMSCRGSCQAGGKIAIFDCANSPTQWEFVSRGPNEVQIKVANRDVCIQEKTGNTLELAQCDSNNQKQRFVAFGGSFNDRRFEVSPKQRQGWCMTQRHHPKNNESVNIEPCVTARRGDTSYWNKY